MKDSEFERRSAESDRIVAVGLLTRRDLALLGNRFDRIYPVDPDNDGFAALLKAIDVADRSRGTPS